MGARINYVFKDSEQGPMVALYSHWGETEWQRDLAMALQHAKPRWQDSAYGTRMIISYLMQDSILEETGFGIYAISNDGSLDLGDLTVLVDFTTNTVTDRISVPFDKFMNAYLPVLVEQIQRVGPLDYRVEGAGVGLALSPTFWYNGYKGELCV